MRVSRRDERMYRLALRVAEDSDSDDPHGAVWAYGARVLAVAANRGRVGVKNKHDHAEARLFRRGNNIAQSGTVYSARKHDFPISKPCEDCQIEMRQRRIRRCVYHDGWRLVELVWDGLPSTSWRWM